MKLIESISDIISGKRAHRNLTFGVALTSAFKRSDRIGYASQIVRESVFHADLFFRTYLYRANARLSLHPKSIDRQGAAMLIDLFVMATILECCKFATFRKRVALSEFLQISEDQGFVNGCLTEFEKSALAPSDFFLKKVADTGLIEGFRDNIEAQFTLRELAAQELKYLSDSLAKFIEIMGESIESSIGDLFPGNLQFIVDSSFIDGARCDVILTYDSLLDWTKENCASTASDPEKAEDPRFGFYYWLRERNLGQENVDPLPDEFREILISDIPQLLQEQKAIAFCRECENYARNVKVKGKKVGSDGALSIVNYTYWCDKGHFLFYKNEKMHLNLRPE